MGLSLSRSILCNSPRKRSLVQMVTGVTKKEVSQNSPKTSSIAWLRALVATDKPRRSQHA